MAWLAQEGRPFFSTCIYQTFMWWLPKLLHEFSLKIPLWKKITLKQSWKVTAFNRNFLLFVKKKSQLPSCKIVMPYIKPVFSLPWAEGVLVTAAEPHPHSRISMESGGRHHETWNIAMVPKGQSGREWEMFIPQISKRYFGMQILRGWFFCQKLETSLKKIKGKVLKSFYRKKINFSHL